MTGRSGGMKDEMGALNPSPPRFLVYQQAYGYPLLPIRACSVPLSVHIHSDTHIRSHMLLLAGNLCRLRHRLSPVAGLHHSRAQTANYCRGPRKSMKQAAFSDEVENMDIVHVFDSSFIAKIGFVGAKKPQKPAEQTEATRRTLTPVTFVVVWMIICPSRDGLKGRECDPAQM